MSDNPTAPQPTPTNYQRTTGGGHLRWVPPTPEHLQEMLPAYEILGILGQGGMGAVYKGRQKSLDRVVAIKILPPEAGEDDMQFVERFKNEARTMAKMNHPSIVHVYDFGETGEGQLYIVMEFIDGTDVAKMIKSQGKLPEDYALSITAHVCDALGYAHKNGIVHRDIKPANVLINMEGQVKVADFGLAKATDPGQMGLTKTNMAMGTPDFVSPEALMPGVPLDGRADLYAVGVMLYNMLTGTIPRGAFRMPSITLKTDARFDKIIIKAMEMDRENRYQTALDLRRDLDVILTTPQIKSGGEARSAAPKQSLPQKPEGKGPAPPQQKKEAVQIHRPKKSNATVVYGIAAVVVVIAGALIAFWGGKKAPVAVPAATAAAKPESPRPETKPTGSKPKSADSNSVSKASEFKPTPKTAAALPLTKAVDLLALVDVTKDAVKGKWLTRPEGLQAHTDTIDGKLQPDQVLGFNQLAPEEYDFEIEFTLKEGNRDVMQVLPSPNGAIFWRMRVPNAGDHTVCGFGPKLDGKDISEAGRTEAVAKAATFQKGQRHRSLVEVRKGSLRALLDGEEIVKWSGDFKRFASDVRFLLPDARHPGIACFNTITTFHKAELRPPGGVAGATVKPAPSATTMPAVPPPSSAPAGPGWIDLMAIADPEKDAEIGLWRREGAGLIGNQDEANKDHPLLALPATVTGSYELELEFTRHGPAGTVSVILPLDGDRIVTAFFQEFSPFAGLADVRGMNTRNAENPTRVPQRLENGKRYRARVQVTLKDANADINVTLENQPLFRYQGPASDLSSRRQETSLKKGVELDIDRPSLESIDPVTWHACWLRPLEGGRVAPVRGGASTGAAGGAVLAMPAALPTSAPPADPRLAQLEAGYHARYESDAQKPFLAAVATLNQSYITNGISRARAAAQAKGALAEVTSLDAEKALIEKGGSVPDEDAAGTPDSLKALRGTYRTAFAKLTAERDTKAAPLLDLYAKALDAYIAELTKADKIKQAQEVQALLEKIAKPKPAATDTVKPAPVPAPVPAPASPATKTVEFSWRKAAEFIMSDGMSSCRLAKDGQELVVNAGQVIPDGTYDIIGIYFERFGSPLPQPTDAEFKVFNGLRTLRQIYVRSAPKLTDDAFSFLADNPDLTSLTLANTGVSERLLKHIVGLKNLKTLDIGNARDLTGKGMKDAAYLPVLEKLILGGTQFNNASAAVLSACQNLQQLNLRSTAVTDAGFEHLQSLGRLTSLVISGTKVTDKAIAAFKEAHPQCKVE
jgi:serine/threonine protein kinase